MPKRNGMDVTLTPLLLFETYAYQEIWLYDLLQTLNKTNDVERDGYAEFLVGPKEWKKLRVPSSR